MQKTICLVSLCSCLLLIACGREAAAKPENSPAAPATEADQVPAVTAPSPGLSSPLSGIPAADREKSAAVLNRAGYDLYTQRSYEKAVSYFKAAVEKEPSLAVTHYNLACTLSLLFGLEKFDDVNLIVRHLHFTWRLDPAHRNKMKIDSDLNPIRSSPVYRAWVAQLDKPAFGVLSARYPESFFQFQATFMYRKNVGLLAGVELNGKKGFILLDDVDVIPTAEFNKALVCPVYFCDDAAYRLLLTKTEAQREETEPLGDLRIEGMSHSMFIVFFNAVDKRIVAELEETGWRTSIALGYRLEDARAVPGWDAIQGERTDFISGWYKQLLVYALDDAGRIRSSRPLTIDAEDLSGGRADLPDMTYKNVRREGDAIVIDKYEDGRFKGSVPLIDLHD